MSLFVLREKQVEEFVWCCLSISRVIFQRIGFSLKSAWKYFFFSFFGLWYGFRIFSLFEPLKRYFYREFPRGTNISDRLTNHRLFCIFHTTLWLVNRLKVLINVFGKSIPFKYQILICHPIKPQYRNLAN